MPTPHSLSSLIEALRRLPGVGAKSAARMAFHMMQHDREGALCCCSRALEGAAHNVKHCQRCYTFTENEVCDTCLDANRDTSQLCVVETPADQAALERTGAYKGLYFVLMGKIIPLDGIGPKEIGPQRLLERASDGKVKEVILATNFTAEGEATAHIISPNAQKPRRAVTRLSRGVPIGSELEYVDLGTIAARAGGQALTGRCTPRGPHEHPDLNSQQNLQNRSPPVARAGALLGVRPACAARGRHARAHRAAQPGRQQPCRQTWPSAMRCATSSAMRQGARQPRIWRYRRLSRAVYLLLLK